MKIQWKKLVWCIVTPLLIGGVSGFITRDSMEIFKTLNKPPLSPPGWLFPVVWNVLYTLMGVASYLVLTAATPKSEIAQAIRLYGLQLAFNFFWTIWFFNFGWYWFSLVWLVALWLLILSTTVAFYRISKPAGLLLLPYLLWVAFAGYLNAGIALLN